ncbi:hypothetical protein, partial [Bordetella pertussis]
RCTHLQTQPGRIQPIDSSQLHDRVVHRGFRRQMKNSSSAQRGTPMPGGRSQVQFRATRIRRVAFHWHRKEEAGGAPAPARGSGR